MAVRLSSCVPRMQFLPWSNLDMIQWHPYRCIQSELELAKAEFTDEYAFETKAKKSSGAIVRIN